MGLCVRCGADLAPDHRFCWSCGAPAPRSGEALIIEADPTMIGSTEHLVTRRGRASTGWIVALVVLLIGAAGWAVLRSDDSSGDDGETALTEPSVLPDPTTTTTETPPTTTPPTTTRRPTTTLAPTGAVSPELADDTGLTLISGSPMVLFDLDTGESTRTTIRNSYPVAVVDGRLIYVRQGESLLSVPLDDLDAEPLRYDLDGFIVAALEGFEPGTVQATVQFNNGDTIYTYELDVASGEVISEQPLDLDALFSIGFRVNAEFRSPRTGGVYRRIGDGWRREIDGAVIASGPDSLLVEACDGGLVCNRRWYSTEFEPIERLIPDNIVDGEVFPGGRLMIYRTSFAGPQNLIDLESGADLVVGLGGFGLTRAVSVSPDGRYATFIEPESFGEPEVVLIDVDTGVRHRFDAAGVTSEFVTPLLVPTP